MDEFICKDCGRDDTSLYDRRLCDECGAEVCEDCYGAFHAEHDEGVDNDE